MPIEVGTATRVLSLSKESYDEDVQKVLGLRIKKLNYSDTSLNITFDNGVTLELVDEGQSCCENRYMHSEDDLPYFIGSVFLGYEVVDAPDEEPPYEDGSHEVMFLNILTDKGGFQMASHNEHNGYYGGFAIVANVIKKKD